MERLLREKLIDGRFTAVTSARSNMMRAVKSTGNKSTELKFIHALESANVKGWKTQNKIVGNPDVLFPIYKVAVFLDGCFWHGCPKCGHVPKTNNEYWKTKITKNIERDKNKAMALEDEGYLIIRFWEHELNENVQGCIDLTLDALEENLFKLSEQLDCLTS